MLKYIYIDSQEPNAEIFSQVILMPQAHRPYSVKYWLKTTVISWLVVTQWVLNVRLERREMHQAPDSPLTKPQQKSALGSSRNTTWFQIFHIQTTPTPTIGLFLLTRFYFLVSLTMQKQFGPSQRLASFKCRSCLTRTKETKMDWADLRPRKK